jgi:hypothetical protein
MRWNGHRRDRALAVAVRHARRAFLSAFQSMSALPMGGRKEFSGNLETLLLFPHSQDGRHTSDHCRLLTVGSRDAAAPLSRGPAFPLL